MELRHLRHVVAIVEEGHVTRAALRLGISQQALSTSLRQVEDELGVALVHRSTRVLRVTHAGDVFVAEAKRLLSQVDQLARTTRDAAGRERLRITYPGPLGALPHSAVALFQKRHPEVDVQLFLRPSHEQEHAVLSGDADMGFIVPPPLSPLVRYQPLVDEELVAALPKSHRLAKRRELSVRDLADEPFVLYSRRLKPQMVLLVTHVCAQAGFSLRVRHEAANEEGLLDFVEQGLGVSLVSRQHEQRVQHQVALRPLSEGPRVKLGAVVRQDDDRAVIRRLVRAFRDHRKQGESEG